MDIAVRLTDLAIMHPRLLWQDISAAAVAVLSGVQTESPFRLELAVRDVPGFGSGSLRMAMEADGVSAAHVTRLQRTYEASRLVELAAIAIAGLGLYHAGGHEI